MIQTPPVTDRLYIFPQDPTVHQQRVDIERDDIARAAVDTGHIEYDIRKTDTACERNALSIEIPIDLRVAEEILDGMHQIAQLIHRAAHIVCLRHSETVDMPHRNNGGDHIARCVVDIRIADIRILWQALDAGDFAFHMAHALEAPGVFN